MNDTTQLTLLTILSTRRCRKCGNYYPATDDYFSRTKKGENSFRAICKLCRAIITHYYYESNRVKIIEKHRLYATTHPEQIVETLRRYRENHRDRWAEYVRLHRAAVAETKHRYYKANIEKYREWSRRYYIDHPEKDRLYAIANPEKRRVLVRNRRARKRGNGGSFTAADILLIFQSQNGKCWWCGKKFKGKEYHIDHRIPLARGGSNAAENIVLTCPACNLRKQAKLPQEFAMRLF